MPKPATRPQQNLISIDQDSPRDQQLTSAISVETRYQTRSKTQMRLLSR